MSSLLLPQRALRFADTSTALFIQVALDRATASGKPARVIGPPGIGKSAAIAELLASHEAIGCTVTQAHANKRAMLKMLLQLHGLPDHSGTFNELHDRVTIDIPGMWGGDRFALSPVILDEYQNFEPQTLRYLMDIQQAVGFPLLVVGNGETLVDRRHRELKLAMKQIESRFQHQVDLGEPLDQDYDAIADEWSVEPDEGTRAALAAYGRRYSLHQLVMLLESARGIARIGHTRLEHLKAALELDNAARLPMLKPLPCLLPTDQRESEHDNEEDRPRKTEPGTGNGPVAAL